MSADTTENDAEIARILAEECGYEWNSTERCRPCSPVLSKKFEAEKAPANLSPIRSQIDEDGELALIMQIEETVLLDNHIHKTTSKTTDVQLEKTHADMTRALIPAEQTDWTSRTLGVFVTIQTRYNDCQNKNQVLIDQLQKLAVQLYPMLVQFQAEGRRGTPKASVPLLAIGLISNTLQGKIGVNDAKEIIVNILKMWNESTVWYEFFEQFVYILLALTVPYLAPGAMGKIMEKVSSLK